MPAPRKKIDWQTWTSIVSVFVALLTYISASQQFEKNYQLSMETNRGEDIRDSIRQSLENEKFVLQLSQQNEQFERNKDLTDEQISLVNKQLEYYRKQVDIQNLQLQVQKEDLEGKRKLRIKEVIKRLTELQTQIANSGVNYGVMQQTVAPEANNLIDEATAISDVNPGNLSSAEYNTVVSWAAQTNKTERLEDLINRGLMEASDASTIYALKNHAASYYFLIKKDFSKGRALTSEIIEMSKKQQVFEDMKTINIAYEYYLWSTFEFNSNNYPEADSLLRIAESLVLQNNAWRYRNYPATALIKNGRTTLDSLKVHLTKKEITKF